MKRAVVRDEEGVWLERTALYEAHGADGWTFPVAGDDAEGSLGVWRSRGDVQLEDVELVSGRVGRGRKWSHDEWQHAWAAGSVVLAPWVSWLARDAWPEIQSWEVVPHIEMLAVRTPTLPPATHTNAFLIGDEQVILVEPAPIEPAEKELLLRWVRQAASRGREPVAVLATHHHHDHVGGADIAETLGLPLWAHAATAERIRAKVERHIAADEVISAGTMRFQAIHTPGHAPGHLCLHHAETGTLIAGDMVAGVGTIIVEPGDGDMGLYLDSLRRLLSLESRRLLPAHGGVIADPRACLEHYLRHRQMREDKVVHALDAQLRPIHVLLPRVYGDVPESVWPLAALSLRAHLDKLVRDGRARRVDETFALCEMI